jgi:hypothetical protein
VDWLAQRFHPDLPREAERALRSAGLAWDDDGLAEAALDQAESIAPAHQAVLLARYRRALYKHRFFDARRWAERLLAHYERAAAGGDDDAQRSYWFALQAYGYVALRCGDDLGGLAVLRRVVALDTADETKTRVLLQVIERAGQPEDD